MFKSTSKLRKTSSLVLRFLLLEVHGEEKTVWYCDTYGWKSMNNSGYVSKYSFYMWLSPQRRMMWYQEIPVVEVRKQVYRIKTGID